MNLGRFHLLFGWGLITLGFLSGGIIGLYFHRESWAGGYGSFRRRMLRLGHIAFVGLGLINILYGLPPDLGPDPPSGAAFPITSLAFVAGALAMPACCLLTAWRPTFRYLFPLPVLLLLLGSVLVMIRLLLVAP